MNVIELLKQLRDFSGRTYENQDTATADTVRQFETSRKDLVDVVIKVTTFAQLFGDRTNQRFKIEAGGNWSVSKIDISTLYFKNATAGSNGVVNIIGTLK